MQEDAEKFEHIIKFMHCGNPGHMPKEDNLTGDGNMLYNTNIIGGSRDEASAWLIATLWVVQGAGENNHFQ